MQEGIQEEGPVWVCPYKVDVHRSLGAGGRPSLLPQAPGVREQQSITIWLPFGDPWLFSAQLQHQEREGLDWRGVFVNNISPSPTNWEWKRELGAHSSDNSVCLALIQDLFTEHWEWGAHFSCVRHWAWHSESKDGKNEVAVLGSSQPGGGNQALQIMPHQGHLQNIWGGEIRKGDKSGELMPES